LSLEKISKSPCGGPRPSTLKKSSILVFFHHN
jgi:hypothetical protein